MKHTVTYEVVVERVSYDPDHVTVIDTITESLEKADLDPWDHRTKVLDVRELKHFSEPEFEDKIREGGRIWRLNGTTYTTVELDGRLAVLVNDDEHESYIAALYDGFNGLSVRTFPCRTLAACEDDVSFL